MLISINSKDRVFNIDIMGIPRKHFFGIVLGIYMFFNFKMGLMVENKVYLEGIFDFEIFVVFIMWNN